MSPEAASMWQVKQEPFHVKGTGTISVASSEIAIPSLDQVVLTTTTPAAAEQLKDMTWL